MPTTLATFRTWQEDRLKDRAAYLSADEKDAAIDQAVLTYSKHRPQLTHSKTAGDGTYEYALPSGWQDTFSQVSSIEYPFGEQEPVYLEVNDWAIKHNGTAYKLRFRSCSPGASEFFLLAWTSRHSVTAGASTVYTEDEQAVADLAASYALRKLAARSAQSRDSTIDADSVNYGGAVASYTALADRLLRQYRDHIGVSDENETGIACSIGEIDTDFAWGHEHLTHPRRWR